MTLFPLFWESSAVIPPSPGDATPAMLPLSEAALAMPETHSAALFARTVAGHVQERCSAALKAEAECVQRVARYRDLAAAATEVAAARGAPLSPELAAKATEWEDLLARFGCAPF